MIRKKTLFISAINKKMHTIFSLWILSGLILGGIMLNINCTPPKQRTDSSDAGTTGLHTLKKLHLHWAPTLQQSDFFNTEPDAYSGFTFIVTSVEDLRENKQQIGTTVGDKKIGQPTIAVNTRDNIEKWCSNALVSAFNFFDIQSTTKGKGIKLLFSVTEFTINETLTYDATVQFRISALNSSDMLLWEGGTKGQVKLPGGSYDPRLYSNAISNSVLKAVSNTLSDKSFKDAIRKGG